MRTWENIYAANSSKLKGVCRRYVKSDEIAEDIMHDAFEIAMKKADSFSGKGSFDGWLYQITVNTALQYLRKNKNIINKNDNILEYHQEKEETIEAPTNKKHYIHQADFDVSDLIEAIDLLPQHHRTVFNLYVLEKYSHQEISEQLDITVNTSKSHLNRARKKLQKILFEKAQHKEKNNLKRLFILLFPFYFSIDRLYANQLKNYSLPTSISRSELSTASTIKSFSYSKLKIAVAILTISTLLITLLYHQSKKTTEQYEAIKILPLEKGQKLQIENHLIEIDSLFALIEKMNSATTTNEQIKNKEELFETVTVKVPVIVRKRVIVNDTIVKK
ncbi:MAG: RNA polymerase sigma factor [Flavobacteriales bacterium]|jgi:RNA polymerase sigma factor (sigma-70 family)|nr:RNA polymerase sigma factor [Flavobacteriales bacterium]